MHQELFASRLAVCGDNEKQTPRFQGLATHMIGGRNLFHACFYVVAATALAKSVKRTTSFFDRGKIGCVLQPAMCIDNTSKPSSTGCRMRNLVYLRNISVIRFYRTRDGIRREWVVEFCFMHRARAESTSRSPRIKVNGRQRRREEIPNGIALYYRGAKPHCTAGYVC